VRFFKSTILNHYEETQKPKTLLSHCLAWFYGVQKRRCEKPKQRIIFIKHAFWFLSPFAADGITLT
jgi:hypothetical protein